MKLLPIYVFQVKIYNPSSYFEYIEGISSPMLYSYFSVVLFIIEKLYDNEYINRGINRSQILDVFLFQY